uniref:Uncharacterized protein n=1 Tax=Anguilla anguilla TaxID=7936 RepID=A0A0E9UCD4_ANGAN
MSLSIGRIIQENLRNYFKDVPGKRN